MVVVSPVMLADVNPMPLERDDGREEESAVADGIEGKVWMSAFDATS